MMRKLGDFAFMLRDYKLALSVFELVKKDFSNDRVFLSYAAVQVCLMLISNHVTIHPGNDWTVHADAR